MPPVIIYRRRTLANKSNVVGARHAAALAAAAADAAASARPIIPKRYIDLSSPTPEPESPVAGPSTANYIDLTLDDDDSDDNDGEPSEDEESIARQIRRQLTAIPRQYRTPPRSGSVKGKEKARESVSLSPSPAVSVQLPAVAEVRPTLHVLPHKAAAVPTDDTLSAYSEEEPRAQHSRSGKGAKKAMRGKSFKVPTLPPPAPSPSVSLRKRKAPPTADPGYDPSAGVMTRSKRVSSYRSTSTASSLERAASISSVKSPSPIKLCAPCVPTAP